MPAPAPDRLAVWSRALLLIGLALAAIAVLPLLLAILFLPADANPIGAGLAFVFAGPLAVICLAAGAVLRVMARFTR